VEQCLGTVFAANAYLSVFPLSTNNRIEIRGGTFVVSNDFGNGALDLRRGTNVLQEGRVEVDRLRVTNMLGV
jgi:hypothetical protein